MAEKPKKKSAANRPAVRRLSSSPEPLPCWVTETREELSYVLLLTDERHDRIDDSLENIDLTREEYISLKIHLAKLRGYVVPEVANASH